MRPGYCGIVLAAGEGRRFGGPKALAVSTTGEPWLRIAVDVLRDGGCDDVLVAVGAQADQVRSLVPPDVAVVGVEHWANGISTTVRAVLAAAAETDADAVVIVTVDTPDMTPSAVARVIGSAGSDPARALVQATYHGGPGHPVVIGREHWGAVAASVRGDVGAGPYLRRHGAVRVECADLWSGADVDSRS